jgi:hypothetical protein
MRVTKEIRDAMVQAALASGRSLAQEAEFRLTQSLRDDEAAGGAKLRSFIRFLGEATSLVEQHTGKSILDDYETAVMARRAWDRLLKHVGPVTPDWVKETIQDINSFPPAPERPQSPSQKDGKPIVNWLSHMARSSSDEDRKLFAEQMEALDPELVARAYELGHYFQKMANESDQITESFLAPVKSQGD